MVKKSRYPIAAGVLAIIAACISALLGSSGILGFATESVMARGYPVELSLVVAFYFLGFAFGLTGGILAMNRSVFSLAVTGMSIMMVTGLLSFVVTAIVPEELGISTPLAFIIFELPILLLAAFGIILTARSKREFT